MALVPALQPGLDPGLRAGLDNVVGTGGGTPQRAFPESAVAWTSAFPTVTAPVGIWTMQEGASPVVDQVGTADLIQNQVILYGQAGDTEPTLSPRLAIQFDSTAATEWTGVADTAYGNIGAGDSRSLWIRFRCPDNGATLRSIWGKGDTTASAYYQLALNATSGTLRFRLVGAVTITATSAAAMDDNAYHDAFAVVDRSGAVVRLMVDDADAVETAIGALGAVEPPASFRFGAAGGAAVLAGAQVSYAAWFDYALSDADRDAIRTAV